MTSHFNFYSDVKVFEMKQKDKILSLQNRLLRPKAGSSQEYAYYLRRQGLENIQSKVDTLEEVSKIIRQKGLSDLGLPASLLLTLDERQLETVRRFIEQGHLDTSLPCRSSPKIVSPILNRCVGR